jgi:hypothetical protein
MMDTVDFPYPEHPYRVIRDGYIYAKDRDHGGIRYLAHNGRLYPILDTILIDSLSFKSIPGFLFEVNKCKNYLDMVRQIKKAEAQP